MALGACGGAAPAQRARSVEAPRATSASEEDAPIPLTKDDAVRGSRLAPVTIVVFSDFQCPYCARLESVFERLHASFGDERLRIVFKNVPLQGHEHARLAAEAGQGVLELAGADAFWRYHARAFREQETISPEAIRAWAIAAGAPKDALEDGLAGRRWSGKIDADLRLSERLEVAATPTAYVNGREVRGAQSFETYKAVVDLELDKARTLAAAGVAAEAVYREATAQNLREAAAQEDDEDEEERAERQRVYRIPVAGAPARGPATAPLTLVVFSDYQCPFCKRFEETLDRVRREYGDKVRVVWRDLPLEGHPRAEPAAQLARAARAQKGEGAFWQVHDALFASAPALETSDLERLAKEAGLDVTKAMKSVSAHADKKGIDADVDLAEDFRVASTPQSFVNGRRLAGARPFDDVKAFLDAELARAEAALAGGTPAAQLYDALTSEGVGPVGLVKRAVAPPPASAPFRGAENAKVVIQEVGDFQCPFCRRGDLVMEEVLRVYAGKVKIVWRDKPLRRHRDAALAAEAAREAFAQKGNAGFQRMAKLLFENQGALKRDDLESYAGIIGLDPARFGRALDERTHKAVVEADDKLTTEAGVDATPAFFIGPYYTTGAGPFSRFRRRIDAALAELPDGPRDKSGKK